jgi:hypothetical protein
MTLDLYDPLQVPDAAGWLILDEGERIQLALDYHARMRVELPNAQLHAVMHATIESQIALGDETPVRLKVRQLMAQGLNRHEAIHAIASVLIKFIADVMRNPEAAGDPNRRYYAALGRLNARKWSRSG